MMKKELGSLKVAVAAAAAAAGTGWAPPRYMGMVHGVMKLGALV